MRLVTPDRIEPSVRVANYHDVPPGRSWGPRTIEDIELILTVRGRFHYEDVAGRDDRLGPGDVLLIEPDVEHIFRRLGRRRATFSCLHLEPVHWARYAEDGYRLEPSPAPVTPTGQDETLRALFEQTARTFAERGVYQRELLSSLARAIWIRLAETWRGREGPMLSARVEQMAEFLRQRYRDPVGRLDLARHFSLTPQYVDTLFRRELRTTPTEFLNRHRVLLARSLIRQEGLSVQAAAEAVGFSDAFYFSKVFKRHLGFPPSKA